MGNHERKNKKEMGLYFPKSFRGFEPPKDWRRKKSPLPVPPNGGKLMLRGRGFGKNEGSPLLIPPRGKD